MYQNEQLYIKMEDLILRTFSGGLSCVKCHRLVPISKNQQKHGFRKHKIEIST